MSSSENQPSKIDLVSAVLFLCGLYTRVFFYITPTLYIPYIACGIVAIYFVVRNHREVRHQHVVPLLLLFAITSFGMALSPDPYGQAFERFKGLVQIVYSISISYFFFLHLRKWHPAKLAKLFLGFALCLLIGSALEVYTPFRELSDAFRHMVFRQGLYEADFRDLFIYGAVRPKLFTPEPSFVAIFYVLSLLVWYSLSISKWRYMLYFLFLFAGFFLIRSPILALSIPLAVNTEIFLRRQINLASIFTKEGPIVSRSLYFTTALAILALALSLSTVFSTRLLSIRSGTDPSFMGRISAPALMMYNTLARYPIYGAGIGGKEAVSDIILHTYAQLGQEKGVDINAPNANFISLFIIYYGIVGGFFFVLTFAALLRSLNIRNTMFVVLAILTFGQTMGAFVTLSTWGLIFILLLVGERSQAEPVSQVPQF